MKESVPEFRLFSIPRICFVITSSAFRDPFTFTFAVAKVRRSLLRREPVLVDLFGGDSYWVSSLNLQLDPGIAAKSLGARARIVRTIYGGRV